MAVLEICTRGSSVKVRDGLFAIGEHRFHPDDVEMIVAEVPSVGLSGDALALMGREGIELVICDGRRMPVASLLPAIGGSVLTARTIRLQAAMSPRRRDALWRRIVRAKIRAQAGYAAELGASGAARIARLAEKVDAGDPSNVEAQAARLYWPAVFGPEFRRNGGGGTNAMLDYGYAVLRAVVARKLHVAGLHRALGIHHDNAENSGNLADDLVEPFRPAVDRRVKGLTADSGPQMDRPARSALAGLGDWPVRSGREWVRLAVGVERLVLSLRRAVEGEPARLDLPNAIGGEEDARRLAKDVGSGSL